MKQCRVCKAEKPYSEFSKNRTAKDGLQSKCKPCDSILRKENKLKNIERERARDKAYYKENRESILKKGKAYYYRTIDKQRERSKRYAEENKDRIKETARAYYVKNKDRINEHHREYYKNNKDKAAKYAKKYVNKNRDKVRERQYKWIEENKDRVRAKQREYEKRRRKECKNYKAQRAMSSMLWRAVKQYKIAKNGKTYDILGYTKEELISRIEFQFKDGMTWENHGQWHIDHKKPISRFVEQGVLDPRVINSLSNLQPLWATDNLSKSNSF